MTRAVMNYLLFLGLLGVLAVVDGQDWMLPGVSWTLAGIAGVWFLWSMRGSERALPVSPPAPEFRDDASDDLQGEARLLGQHVPGPASVQERLIKSLDQLIGELQGLVRSMPQTVSQSGRGAEPVTIAEEQFNRLSNQSDVVSQRLEELLERVDLVKRHSGEVAVRLEQVMARDQAYSDRLALVTRQCEDQSRQLSALESRGGQLAEKMLWLAEQAASTTGKVDTLVEQGAHLLAQLQAVRAERQAQEAQAGHLFGPLDQAVEGHGADQGPPGRRSLSRRMNLRTAARPAGNDVVAPPPAQPAPHPAPPLARALNPVPLKVQVTTYQKGEAPKQRDINVRLGGRFF